MIKGNSGIYAIINIYNGDRYIGSSSNCEWRFFQHLSSLKSGKNSPKLQNSWNKYGSANFVFVILERCSIDILIKKEQFYIDNLQPEFNIRKLVAQSNLGTKWTEEQRRKKSIIHKGMSPPNKGIKTNKPAWNRGIPQTKETCQKLRDAHKGRHHSPNTEFKIGRCDPSKYKKVRCIELNKIFKSIKDASLFVGNERGRSNISACCTGKQTTAYGYHWEYA